MSEANNDNANNEQPEKPKAKAWEELAAKAAAMDTEEDAAKNAAEDAENVAHEAISMPSHEELVAKINQLEAHQEDLLRSLAKTQDVLKRAEKEKVDAGKFGITKLAQALLPVVDSLELSLQAIAIENEALKGIHEGIEMTLKMFLNTLEKYGVTVVNPVNEKFDPTYHEAISMQESTELAAGTVLNVLQKGYLLHERLIRPAMVIVSKAASDTKVTD